MNENPFFYVGENPSVDLVVISPDKKVLMITRSTNAEACAGMLAFPGGFIDSDAIKGEHWKSGLETPEDAALRELKEETNLEINDREGLKPIGIYTGNQRDPRDNDFSWSTSHAFLYQIDQLTFEEQKDKIKGMDDAEEAQWVELALLQKKQLAFDHNKILEDAIKLI